MQYGTINGDRAHSPTWQPLYGNAAERRSFISWLLTCCGMLEKSKSSIKPRKIPMKVEPKVFLANERTLLSWIHMAVWLGSIAALLLSAAERDQGPDSVGVSKGARIGYTVGMLLLPVSILFIGYALATFYWRGKKIRARIDGDFHDTFGPTVLAGLLMLALCAIFAISLLDGIGVSV